MRHRIKKYIYLILLFPMLSAMVFGRSFYSVNQQDSSALRGDSIPLLDSISWSEVDSVHTDSLTLSGPDSLAANSVSVTDSLPPDSARTKKPFLDEPITGKNKDSLVYDLANKTVYIYNEGDVTYQNKNLKADFMRINMESKDIYAYGVEDTATHKPTRPVFVDGGSTFTMDTMTYNLGTGKAKIKGISTQEGEGLLLGQVVKRMNDQTINVAHGKYTTCDADHPHFYLAMTRAKAIPGKKVIVGPSYMVMEDVPLPFLGLPFGFFPMNADRSSGFIMPEYGEEVVKGFFIRNGGYYLAFNDYVDAALTAGIYTLGSWEANAASRYVKRYKYSGNLNVRFSKDILGEKGSADYVNMNNFRVGWTHTQDPKFRPNSTFAASVNFSTSGYSKYGAQNLSEYLNTQTNSSISYSKKWAGKPFSFSTNVQHSQSSKDTTVSLSLPNIVFNVSRIFPFQRKDAVGKQRWYEKISLSYTGDLKNSVTVKERDLFTQKMYDNLRNGVSHTIPITTSWNILKYINISPSANYKERWYFRKIDKKWDEDKQQVVNSDTTNGFYRVYDYNFSAGASTKVYGTYQFKKGAMVEAIRHTLTPSVSFGYTPDFSKSKYGYYKEVQSDAKGNTTTYSPFQDGIYGLPGRGESASMSFSLVQTLEAKVRSKTDTSGVRKIKIIDNLSISSSYNFLADSLNLAPFSLGFRTNLFKNVGLNVNAVLDPYQVNEQGQRINKFLWSQGKIGRLASVSTSFGYSFNSPQNGSSTPAVNDINSGIDVTSPAYMNYFNEPGFNDMDANTRRALMSSKYYNFDIPWNFGFNYSFNYSNTGIRTNVNQTLGFNGSVSLTPKWGVTFNGGFDFQMKKLTPGVFTLTRDLHCWQMSFSWVPIGYRKSWSFNIGVKSGMLKDLKYDRNSSFYDNLYDN